MIVVVSNIFFDIASFETPNAKCEQTQKKGFVHIKHFFLVTSAQQTSSTLPLRPTTVIDGFEPLTTNGPTELLLRQSCCRLPGCDEDEGRERAAILGFFRNVCVSQAQVA